MTNHPSVSAIVHTYNEELNIENCLSTLTWVDEIIVIDMESTDQTVKKARTFTSNIFTYPHQGFADPARQFGLTKAKHEWILVVDADELIPVSLKETLLKLISEDQYDVIHIPRQNYFFGKALIATGWAPFQDYQIRCFRKSAVTYSEHIHQFTHLASSARSYAIKNVQEALIHLNYNDPDHFLEKMARYTTIEAQQRIQAKNPLLGVFGIFKEALSEFFRRYVKFQGYRDGIRGLSLSILMMTYRTLTHLKAALIQELGSQSIEDEVRRKHQDLVKEIIHQHSSS